MIARLNSTTISFKPGCSPGQGQDRGAEGKDLGAAVLASTENYDHLECNLAVLQKIFQNYLGDRLGSRLKIGFSLTASSCFVQNLFGFFVVFEVELLCPKLEIIQPLCSPDVVHGRDKW